MESGLYARLTSEGLLIPHEEVQVPPLEKSKSLLILKPVRVPFVSYPFEWCFGQFKAAALATLRIQKIAMEFGMTLKDASAYNIQFHQGRPVLIDTLSFKVYKNGAPWTAYRQFCQHFFVPIMLMAKVDITLGRMMRIYLDGIPLDVAGAILPFRTFSSLPAFIHIHLHGWAQKSRHKWAKPPEGGVSKNQLAGIVDSLDGAIRKLELKVKKSEWADYYADTNYSSRAFAHKQAVVKNLIRKTAPRVVWDLGANTGLFSRMASDSGIPTLAFDLDPLAVECNWIQTLERQEHDLFPLVMDFGNPTPGIGWENSERDSLFARANADTVMALALVHHLAITLNLPFGHIVRFLARLAKHVIIEFIPKTDSQVIGMLASREDIFPEYCEQEFESAFAKSFTLVEKIALQESQRIVYLFTRNP
ncbi:MAG: SAM-dependent methyltransferase [Fibrobacteria bacterium]